MNTVQAVIRIAIERKEYSFLASFSDKALIDDMHTLLLERKSMTSEMACPYLEW